MWKYSEEIYNSLNQHQRSKISWVDWLNSTTSKNDSELVGFVERDCYDPAVGRYFTREATFKIANSSL